MLQGTNSELGGSGARLLLLAFGRQGWADLCEFKTSLVYKSSRTCSKTTEKPCLEGKKKKIFCNYRYFSTEKLSLSEDEYV